MSASICTPYEVFEEPTATLACFMHAETLGTGGSQTQVGLLPNVTSDVYIFDIMLGPKKMEGSGGSRALLNDTLRGRFSSPNIMRILTTCRSKCD